MIMPIYRSDFCLYLAIEFNHAAEHAVTDYQKYRITVGQTIFLFINWLEIAYLYLLYKELTKVKHD